MMQTGTASGPGRSMTAKNLPAEIIKLTELFSVGLELQTDKNKIFWTCFVLFFKISYSAQYLWTFVLCSLLLLNCPSNNFAELFSCQH